MKINIIFISHLIYIIFLFPFNAFPDFNNEIPGHIPLDDKNNQSTNSHNSNNTVRKKYENDKKENINSDKKNKPSNNGNLDSDFNKHNVNAPVFFKGDSAEGSRKTGILTLINNVEIIQDDTKLTSEKAQLFGSPGTTVGSGSKSVQKAIATGNVHITKKSNQNTPEMKATANSIEFLVPKRIMILKGKAKVWKAQEYVNAEYIEINLDTGDIKLKDPHGTIDPKASANYNNNSTQNTKSNNKVAK